MATYTPTRPIDHVGHGQEAADRRLWAAAAMAARGDGSPNYGVRLRRARLGMICAIATICMVFVSLTSALIVRRGLPTFDDASRTYFRDWGGVQLPWLLLAINTAILLISSLTMEGARRGIARRAALAPVRSIPGVSLGEERNFPWLGVTVILGLAFLVGQGIAWGELEKPGIFCQHESGQFVRLFVHGGARGTSAGRDHCVVVGRHHFPAAQADRRAADRGGCCGLVLAFHGGVVDLRFRLLAFVR